jgi:hypothetical protein
MPLVTGTVEKSNPGIHYTGCTSSGSDRCDSGDKNICPSDDPECINGGPDNDCDSGLTDYVADCIKVKDSYCDVKGLSGYATYKSGGENNSSVEYKCTWDISPSVLTHEEVKLLAGPSAAYGLSSDEENTVMNAFCIEKDATSCKADNRTGQPMGKCANLHSSVPADSMACTVWWDDLSGSERDRYANQACPLGSDRDDCQCIFHETDDGFKNVKSVFDNSPQPVGCWFIPCKSRESQFVKSWVSDAAVNCGNVCLATAEATFIDSTLENVIINNVANCSVEDFSENTTDSNQNTGNSAGCEENGGVWTDGTTCTYTAENEAAAEKRDLIKMLALSVGGVVVFIILLLVLVMGMSGKKKK